MAENNIGIFAISTFNTDYVLIKSKNFSKAIELLSKTGYRVAEQQIVKRIAVWNNRKNNFLYSI